ncbi:hypothetical protein [Streptococcus pseudopneumoniae]|uniref:hypothetical protein n=1 Tax=Streptococcus pseudopneumoniae TaxID=257758 RepID=UPI00066B37B9|nr:hypothetical protein [Streptococcus pseudopneumoniae]
MEIVVLFIILILIGALIIGYNYLLMQKNQEIYRIKVIDNLNGRHFYVSYVDGIKEEFKYSNDSKLAIQYYNLRDAQHIIGIFESDNTTFIIQKQTYSYLGTEWVDFIENNG